MIIGFLIFASPAVSEGQKLDEVTLHYKIKLIEGADLTNESIVAAIKSMGMRITVKGDLYKLEVIGLQHITMIMDYAANVIHTLIDMGERKFAIRSSISEYQEQKSARIQSYRIE